MGKTSFKSYIIAGLTGLLIISVFVINYGLAGVNYDTTHIDISDLEGYDEFRELAQNVNSTATNINEETVGDTSLFDVLGGLIVNGLKSVKLIWNGINFATSSIGSLMSGLNIDGIFVLYVSAVIMISIASVFIFRYVIKSEDEK